MQLNRFLRPRFSSEAAALARPLTVLLRSDSGPNLSRFAVAFSTHGGGDALWLAYVPDSLRAWFDAFAESCDPTTRSKCPLRIARLFSSPGPSEIDFLLERVGRHPDDHGDLGPPPPDATPSVIATAEEIERGALHVTTLVLDLHHLPILTRLLRADATAFAARHHLKRPAPDWLTQHAVQRFHDLVQALRGSGLNLIVATPSQTGAERAGRLANRLEAALFATLDEAVDLELLIGTGTSSAVNGRFEIEICRSTLTDLPLGSRYSQATWSELLAVLEPSGSPLASFHERLDRTCPRSDGVPLTRTEPTREWIDDTQEEFTRWAEKRGWTVERARPEEDRIEHWDVAIIRPGERYRVDVKARSRIRRSDVAPRDDWHWVELRGIVDGGWLFAGQADLIAFQTSDSFLLVWRSELAAHVLYHVDPECVVARQADAAYRAYHRLDRDDAPRRATGADRGVLTLIPTSRLRILAWDEFPPKKPARK